MERGPLWDIRELSEREIVDDVDLVPLGEKRIGNMAADEPGPTGDDVLQEGCLRPMPR